MSDSTIEPPETDEDAQTPPEDDGANDADTNDSDAPEADEDEESDWRKNFDPDKAAQRITKLQSEAKNLRSRAKQAEEKAQDADQKDERITALEAENLRYQVGYELGLPKELVGRLQGQTREDLIEDARGLLELVKVPGTRTRKPVEVLRGGGDPDQEPEEQDLDKIARRMAGR